MSTHVAVIMGGWSAEREVSLVTGAAISQALTAQGYRVTDIDADKNIGAVLTTVKPDVPELGAGRLPLLASVMVATAPSDDAENLESAPTDAAILPATVVAESPLTTVLISIDLSAP